MDRIDPQPWMETAAVRRVMGALERARAGSTRFVGGCVRNALLGEKVADIDIATQLTPTQVAVILRTADIAVHPTGIEHGTITAVADGQPFEVTTLRRDVETDGRRAVVAFTEDWAEDAQRRDFRMNALYATLEGALFDPTGGGLADIRSRRIVFVGDAETRIREDYLRILRFFRFNAWYGRGWLNAEGLGACGRLKTGLSAISSERIWSETKKLLAAPDPVPALSAMEHSGVFAQLYPEAHGLDLLRTLVGIESVRRLPADPMRRFLSLFSKDGDVLAAAARRLKLSNEERDRLVFSARDETPVGARHVCGGHAPDALSQRPRGVSRPGDAGVGQCRWGRRLDDVAGGSRQMGASRAASYRPRRAFGRREGRSGRWRGDEADRGGMDRLRLHSWALRVVEPGKVLVGEGGPRIEVGRKRQP